ncbi:hypothetical protein [Pyrococcus sp. ST04]|uniref:hypothetical protein n=1 Tax=Pyrococcus sp. ST04 TaxID=1183377 RepID=UPI0002605F15|nr:hypothetical protein [Pyrococcus sp. ST04]AFK22645.1 hypothetical protein Py04_1070 [Pyrococcus sp. ST04]
MSPATLHTELQNELVQLGNKFGFLATKEYPLENLYPGYSPIIDVVWFYPLSEAQSSAIYRVYDLWPYWKGSKALYPYAAFEITSLDATSKTIMSEIWNLKLAGFRYSFNVVPSKNPKHPDYMHKERAERIARTLKHFSGVSDAFVISIKELQKVIYNMKNSHSDVSHIKEPLLFKTPRLRDNLHNNVMQKLTEFGKKHGFISVIEYTPKWLKRFERRVTFIRHDVVWLLELPANTEIQFKEFLNSLGVTPIRDISPIEVLAFEVELGTFDKHSIGSVLNLAKITGRGVLVIENKKPNLVETVRLISSNRVDVKSIAECEELFRKLK